MDEVMVSWMEACPAQRPLLYVSVDNLSMRFFLLPGVGSYEAGPAIDALKTKHIAPTGPTANFASNAPRLQTIKSTSMASPGCVSPLVFIPSPTCFAYEFYRYATTLMHKKCLCVLHLPCPIPPFAQQAWDLLGGEQVDKEGSSLQGATFSAAYFICKGEVALNDFHSS